MARAAPPAPNINTDLFFYRRLACGFKGVGKADAVGIVARRAAVSDGDGVDGPDGLGQGVDAVQAVHDTDFMGNGDVVAGKIHFGDAGGHGCQVFGRYFNGQVAVVQPQGLKGPVVHGRRKTVPQRTAQQSDQLRPGIDRCWSVCRGAHWVTAFMGLRKKIGSI